MQPTEQWSPEPDERTLVGVRLRLAVGRPRREKVFLHHPSRIDRNERVRILLFAKATSRRLRTRGSHGGPLTHAREKVLRSLLYDFLNWQDGRCFPSYEGIAKAAGVARSVVGEALKVIEALGVIRIVNRIMRVRWSERDGNGQLRERWRVMRTSNSYEFVAPPNVQNQPLALRPSPLRDGTTSHERQPIDRRACAVSEPSSSGSQTGTHSKSFSLLSPRYPNSSLEKARAGMQARLVARWAERRDRESR